MVPGMCVIFSVIVDLDIPSWIYVLTSLCELVGVVFLVMAFIPKKKSTRKASTSSKVKKDDKVISELKKATLCPSCGKSVTHISIELNGKNINGVKCKRCNQMYCLSCYNPTKRLLTCEKCGNKEFSFLVDGA